MPTLTTETPRTNNVGSYALHEVEPVEGASRFALAKNFEGHDAASTGDSIAAAYRELAAEGEKQATVLRTVKDVPLKYVGRDQEGNIVTVSRGVFRGVQEYELSRSGKFRNVKEKGGELLDRFLLEPSSYDARDEQLYEALAHLLHAENITDNATIRVLNDSLHHAIITRAGLSLGGFDKLPRIGS